MERWWISSHNFWRFSLVSFYVGKNSMKKLTFEFAWVHSREIKVDGSIWAFNENIRWKNWRRIFSQHHSEFSVRNSNISEWNKMRICILIWWHSRACDSNLNSNSVLSSRASNYTSTAEQWNWYWIKYWSHRENFVMTFNFKYSYDTNLPIMSKEIEFDLIGWAIMRWMMIVIDFSFPSSRCLVILVSLF